MNSGRSFANASGSAPRLLETYRHDQAIVSDPGTAPSRRLSRQDERRRGGAERGPTRRRQDAGRAQHLSPSRRSAAVSRSAESLERQSSEGGRGGSVAAQTGGSRLSRSGSQV